MNIKKPLGKQALKSYSVNSETAIEEIQWSLYDFEAYANAGQSVLTFFQSPVGANGKTLEDTNMDTAGQIPKGMNMLVEALAVEFFPGVASASATLSDLADDVREVYEGGFLDFKVGSKKYKTEGPLGVYPPQWGVDVRATTGLAAGNVTSARCIGDIHTIIPVRLTSNQNFSVSLNWPTPRALPSGVDGRIGVRLIGRMFRNSQ